MGGIFFLLIILAIPISFVYSVWYEFKQNKAESAEIERQNQAWLEEEKKLAKSRLAVTLINGSIVESDLIEPDYYYFLGHTIRITSNHRAHQMAQHISEGGNFSVGDLSWPHHQIFQVQVTEPWLVTYQKV